MSSMSITSRRQIWSNQHPLRKHKSLIDNNGGYLNSSSIINSNLLNSQRTKYSLLQKQFSVDKIYNNRFNNNNNNYNNNNNSNNSNNNNSANGRSLSRQDHNQGRCSSGNNNRKLSNTFNRNNSVGQSSLGGKESSELSVFLTSKKKTVLIGNGDKKETNIGRDRLSRKSSKGGDDKVNLNIFLGQSVIETTEYDDGIDYDVDSSDVDSSDVDSSTKGQRQIIQSNRKPKTLEKQLPLDSPIRIPTIRKPFSAASRRAQFQANRENSINLSKTSIITAAPSLTISSRPPLLRAMSAPVRTLDENSKYILANKRKSRRRKILGRQSTCDKTSPTNNNLIINNNNNNNNNNNKNNNNNNINNNNTTLVGDENNENLNEKNRGKQNNKSFSRSRPELGCDVVTLVSLISSEGSDSEKEEIVPSNFVASPVKRAPNLRKTGKSVSFQEHDIPNFTTVTKEFPHMLRRGSVAPLAARIRANRPPTAPPVSIFIADFENSHTKMSEKIKSSSKEDLSTTNTLTHQSDSKDCVDKDNSVDNQFPEYARTIKERECWKLFQKMSNKGVSVSYDTILRGMLTPTELRHLQKQREHEEAKQQKQDEQTQLNEQLKK